MLNKVLRTMLKLKIIRGASDDCTGSTLAFVSVTRNVDGVFIKSKRDEGAYVVNVCDRFWQSIRRLQSLWLRGTGKGQYECPTAILSAKFDI